MKLTDKLIDLGITPANGDQFEPLSETAVDQFERHLGKSLPDDYRFFLLTYGESDFEVYAVFQTSGGGVAPGTFFGQNVEDVCVAYDERLPKGVVPINDDGMGNLTCISVREDTYGIVYYQSHTVGTGSGESDIDMAKFGTLVKLAPDFTSFIQGLKPQD